MKSEAGHFVFEARSNPGVTKALHIRPTPRDDRTAIPFEAALVDGQLPVETCSDVYRGLARLCRADLDPPFAVFVCVDALLPSEYEFFSLASNLRRRVPIYVYGGHGSASSIHEAIELGATGEATPEALEALICLLSAPRAEPVLPERREDAGSVDAEPSATDKAFQTPTPARHGTAAEEIAAAVTEDQPSRVAPDDGSAESNTEPAPADQVRVPWLHYADRPKRAGPQRQPPPSSGADVSGKQPAPPAPAPHEPLLTEAELQALMGDDIAAIAPAEEPGEIGEDNPLEGNVP